MREGKYVEEVYRRVCEMKDSTNALGDVMKIANDVAREHPLQYERFRIWSWCVLAWRRAVSDVRNVFKFLAEERARRRPWKWLRRLVQWMRYR